MPKNTRDDDFVNLLRQHRNALALPDDENFEIRERLALKEGILDGIVWVEHADAMLTDAIHDGDETAVRETLRSAFHTVRIAKLMFENIKDELRECSISLRVRRQLADAALNSGTDE
jgi:hypothetical protein